MKRSHLGIMIIVILCASFWVVATQPMFGDLTVQIAPPFLGYR